ncbi:MFS transporter [Agrobacterium sp. NPDC090283]|uniref:MFS transporter n=1 Tax=Agrobacterium sp. NPDC090283 TaxID=3363920 RepID=UPI00383B3CB8
MSSQSTANVKLQYSSERLTGRHVALLALLMACGFIVVGQLYVTIPMVAGIADRFGVERAHAALIGTAFGMAYAAGFLIFGPLSDRYGRKRMILIGLVSTAVATVLVGLAGSFDLLLAARAAQGLAASIFPPVALSLVTEELPPQQRPLGVSLMSFAFLGAAPLAQLFAAQTDGSLFALMLELAPLYLLGAAGLLFAVTAKGTALGATPVARTLRFASLLRDPAILAAWAAAITVLFGFVSFYSGAQSLGPRLGVDLQSLRLMGLPPLLLTFAAAPMTRRYGAAVTARFGLSLAALALAIAAIASPLAIGTASAVLSAGVAFAVPGLIATVAGRATNANRGLALAIYSFALFLGASFAPPVAQALGGIGTVPLWLLPAILLLAAALALTVGIRRPHSPTSN